MAEPFHTIADAEKSIVVVADQQMQGVIRLHAETDPVRRFGYAMAVVVFFRIVNREIILPEKINQVGFTASQKRNVMIVLFAGAQPHFLQAYTEVFQRWDRYVYFFVLHRKRNPVYFIYHEKIGAEILI